MAQTTVERLHPEAILKYWIHIEPAIASALDYGAGETKIFTWFKNLISKPDDYHLWVVFQEGDPVNITLTKWNYYDTHISLHLVTTGSVGFGSWRDYKEAHHEIERFAKWHNARRIEFWGRRGWLRAIKQLRGEAGEEYKETYRVMSMELDKGD